jgi:hypothetical protein
VLVRGLPPGSATWRAVTGETDHWTRSEQLLAGIFDGIRVLDWRLVSIYGKGKPPPPDPLERPGVKPRQGRRIAGRTVVPLEEARGMFPPVESKGEVTDDG